jgi:hypothetical protein
LVQKADAVIFGFAHSENSAAANRDAGPAHGSDRIQTFLVNPCADDGRVKLGRRIQIMVVSGKTRIFELSSLRFRQHAQRAADLHPKPCHRAYGFQHCVKVAAFGRLSPCGTHAEAGSAIGFCAAGGGQNFIAIHQRLALHPGGVARALRTVSAILWTSTGLDGKQPAHLHFIGRMKFSMYSLSLHNKIEQRLMIDGSDFVACPIHTHGGAIINPFRVRAHVCLTLQEVAYKARRAEKRLVVFPAAKGLDLSSLHKRLVTAKLTGAGPNVTILKLLRSKSIDKVDGLASAVLVD